MRLIRVTGLTAVLLFAISVFASGEEIYKEFDAKSAVEIRTVSGDCEIVEGDSDKITVRLVEKIRPPYVFEPYFEETRNELRVGEQFHGSSSGSSTWYITVPQNTEIDFNSASGSLRIDGLEGEFYGSTASGDYIIKNCKGAFDLNTASGDCEFYDTEGEFDANSASGDIEVNNTVVTKRSEFSSASGDVEATGVKIRARCAFGSASGDAYVVLGDTPQDDLRVNSASGDALLKYAGNEMAGYFEVSAKKRGGKIRADIEFDDEEEFLKNSETYIRKTATMSDDERVISVGTASGKAELRK